MRARGGVGKPAGDMRAVYARAAQWLGARRLLVEAQIRVNAREHAARKAADKAMETPTR